MTRVQPILVTLAVALMTAAPAMSQDRDSSPLDSIERAFSTGSADSITAMSADRIEIAVLGKSRLYSRTQAKYVLRDFFEQYPPLQVKLSEPSATEKGLFAAGTYRFATDREPLRLYVRLRRGQSEWALREIVLERAVR
jgi:hypothetical protein